MQCRLVWNVLSPGGVSSAGCLLLFQGGFQRAEALLGVLACQAPPAAAAGRYFLQSDLAGKRQVPLGCCADSGEEEEGAGGACHVL